MSVYDSDLIDSERSFNKAKVLSLNIVKIDVHQCQNWRPVASGGVVGKLNNARLFQM